MHWYCLPQWGLMKESEQGKEEEKWYRVEAPFCTGIFINIYRGLMPIVVSYIESTCSMYEQVRGWRGNLIDSIKYLN